MTTETIPELIEITDAAYEPRYRILIHNDDVTTFDFLIHLLARVFALSREMAEHIALTAHIKGLALVMVRPRRGAERLVQRAHLAARLEGFPLFFTLEPES